MARKVIANLATLLTADATQFAAEFKRADNVARRMSASINKTVAKPVGRISLGLLGAGGVAALLTRELRSVITDIESIPGIPPAAAQSIAAMNEGVSELRNTLRRAAAQAISFGADFARAVGAGAAMLMGASGDDVSAGLMAGEWNKTADQVAAERDAGFYDKVSAAQARLKEATRKAGLATMTQGEQVMALRAEAEKYDKLAALTSQNSLQQTESLIKAAERKTEADKLAAKVMSENEAAMKRMALATAPLTGATVHSRESIDALRESLGGLYHQLGQIGDGDDILSIERRTKVYEDIAAVSDRITKGLEHQKRIAQQVGDAFENSFEDAIFSGEKFKDVLGNLGQALAKLVLRNSLLNPVANWLSGGVASGLTRVFGFANGGRPAPGRPAMVGERGPELFIPDTAGRVIPAERTAAMLGGGGGGGGTKIFNIDARGADVGAVARLEGMVRELNGTFNRRVVSVVSEARMRGGSLGRALS
jgi:hypothetical protein